MSASLVHAAVINRWWLGFGAAGLMVLVSGTVTAQGDPPTPPPNSTDQPPTAPPSDSPPAASDQPRDPANESTGATGEQPPSPDEPPPAEPAPPPVTDRPEVVVGPVEPLEPPEPEPADDRWGQRYVGFGPRIGVFWGFGAGVRAGHPYVGVDIAGGWQPILVFIDKQTIGSSSSSSIEVEGAHTGQFSGNVYVTFNPKSRFMAGLTAGYRYNSVLSHGLGLGFDGVLNMTRVLAMQFNAGILIFPDGSDRFAAELGLPKNTDFGFPSPTAQVGIGVGLLIYP